MAAGQESDEESLDEIVLADDDLREGGAQLGDPQAGALDVLALGQGLRLGGHGERREVLGVRGKAGLRTRRPRCLGAPW